MFEIVLYKFRIRRYLPCCADEAVHTSWLRKLTEADRKNNNLQSGGSSCENTKKCKIFSPFYKSCFCVWLTDLQVFVRRDPVPPYSKHTNDVMFVWEELPLFWLLLLQANFMQTVQCGAHIYSIRLSSLLLLTMYTSTVYDNVHSQSSGLLQNHWQQVWWAIIHWNNSGCTHRRIWN